MKLNKRTQDLLNEFESAVTNLEKAALVGNSCEDMLIAKAEHKNAEKKLNRHLFQLEERIRKYRRWWFRAKAETV